MKAKKILLAAGFVLAGVTAATASNVYEPTNAVPNGLTSQKTQQIRTLSAKPAGVTHKRVRSHKSGIYGKRSFGFPTRSKGFGHILNNPK